ncbi:MAG: hypothetical protein MH252_19600 [Thermosynechococcaceae cyanobacterium MS004]|nr:hypothetical protein [Thermosynechococcaceae cyanobacterium MS004]
MSNLNWTELKAWVKAFASKSGLLSSASPALEDVITLLNSRYQRRLSSIRINIAEDFPGAVECLDSAIAGERIEIPPTDRQDFTDYLLSRVLNADVLITVEMSAGERLTLSLEVQESGAESNRPIYPNIAEVRQLLGIDKHLILVLENQLDRLPKHQKLIQEIHEFCAEQSLTKVLDLTDLAPWDLYDLRTEYEGDPGRMWEKYSEGINASASNLIALEAAKRAFRDKHSSESVYQMLTQEPTYLELVKRDKGNPKFADLHAKAIRFSAEAEVAQEPYQPVEEQSPWDAKF